jgi:hypothetical protein
VADGINNGDQTSRKMKTTFIVWTLLIFCAVKLHSQDKDLPIGSGVYLTEQDFSNNVLTDYSLTDDENYLVERFSKKVEVSRNGIKRVYRFGAIYGYLKDGIKYRSYGSSTKFFSDYGYYKVIDDSGLIIYAKKSSGHKSGGRLWYYYSNSLTSPLKLISKRNLRKDFNDRPYFLELVAKSVKSREYLVEVEGKLLINQIYLSEQR